MSVWRISFLAICFFYALIALVILSKPSSAQQGQVCDTEHVFLRVLYEKFKEFPVFRGESQGRHFILTRADGQGNWTLIMVANGKACISDAGGRSRFDKGV